MTPKTIPAQPATAFAIDNAAHLERLSASRAIIPTLYVALKIRGYTFMKTTYIILLSGFIFCGCCSQKRVSSASPAASQIKTDDVSQLTQRVAQLENQVQEISRIVEPLKVQQTMESRQKAFRDKFMKRVAQDQAKYTPKQLGEAEDLYQVANRKWGSPEAAESLQTMIKTYPDINRTGCAVLYVAQMSQGNERAKYLQDCIVKYNDCFYGDGVQVGVYARFLLAQDYKSQGEVVKAKVFFDEIKSKYADAIDHRGNLLVNSIGQ